MSASGCRELLTVEEVSESEPLASVAKTTVVHSASRRGRLTAVAAVGCLALGSAAYAWRGRSSAAVVTARSVRLFSAETLAAYERLDRNLADIDVEVPGTPPGLNQTKLAHVQCSIDVGQAAAYLGAAIVWIDKAVTYDGYTCPFSSQRGCAVSVETAITAMLWVASYLSLTASSCTATLNAKAACAADVTAIMANMGEVATAGTAAADDCDFGDADPPKASVHSLLEWTRHQNYGRRLSGGPIKSFLNKVSGHEDQQARHAEKLDHALCAFDVVQSASYVIRAIKQIMGATIDTCADAEVCTINVFSIISSFAWLSQFLSFASADCATEVNQAAYCAGDISDLIAATTNLVATGIVIKDDCGAAKDAPQTWPDNQVLQEVQETKRRLRTATVSPREV